MSEGSYQSYYDADDLNFALEKCECNHVREDHNDEYGNEYDSQMRVQHFSNCLIIGCPCACFEGTNAL